MNGAIEKLLEQLNKLGFGFAMGAGLAGIVYLFLNSIFTIDASVLIFIYSGGALGLGLNRLIDKLIKSILNPIYSYIRFYFSLLEIVWLKNLNFLNADLAKNITQKLIYRRFLNEEIEFKESQVNLLSSSEIEEKLELNQVKEKEKNPIPDKM